MRSFSKVFKELRLKKELTQQELANKLGVSRSTVGMYEKGEREPDFIMLERIADFFNVDINYLLGKSLYNTQIRSGHPQSLNIDEEIQALITYLTGDNSVYCYGEIMSEEGKLALLNSLKQDKEFLTALYKKENK